MLQSCFQRPNRPALQAQDSVVLDDEDPGYDVLNLEGREEEDEDEDDSPVSPMKPHYPPHQHPGTEPVMVSGRAAN